MIKLTDIFRAVNETLLASFEEIRSYKERINKQKRPDMSVELISFTTSPHSRYIINKSIDLDIIYFSKGNTVGEALKIADRSNFINATNHTRSRVVTYPVFTSITCGTPA